jgi:hypothetical protein
VRDPARSRASSYRARGHHSGAALSQGEIGDVRETFVARLLDGAGEDFRGLRQLKERLGPRLEEAIILYTGEHAYTHDDWIAILPLDRLWAST